MTPTLPQITDAPGQVLSFGTDVAVVGVMALESFTSVELLTGAASFQRLFRLRRAPGLEWSTWRELTDDNLAALSLDGPTAIWLQFRYTQVGAGTAELVSLTLTGVYANPAPEAAAVVGSALARIDTGLEDTDQTDLEAHLLRRLYFDGILPRFIERPEHGDDGELLDPVGAEGWIALFGAASAVLARVLRYARELPHFDHQLERLRPWLAGHGLLFSPTAIDVRAGRALARQLGRRMLQRGTAAVGAVGDDDEVAGELRLLVDHLPGDSFYLAPVPGQGRGWVMGQSSPTYHGTETQPGLHGIYGAAVGPSDVNDYPIRRPYDALQPQHALQDTADAARYGFQIRAAAGNTVLPGTGLTKWLRSTYVPQFNDSTPLDTTRVIRLGPTDGGPPPLPVDDGVDYELSFWLRQEEVAHTWFRLGVLVLNREGDPLPAVRIDSGAEEDTFIERVTLNAAHRWQFVRFLLWNRDRVLSDAPEVAVPNLGLGRNLRLPPGAAGIIPLLEYSIDEHTEPEAIYPGQTSILTYNEALAHFGITGLKLRPIANGQTVATMARDGSPAKGTRSLGFLGGHGLVQFWAVNNGHLQTPALLEKVNRYLVPAGTLLLHEPLGLEVVNVAEKMIDFDDDDFASTDFA